MTTRRALLGGLVLPTALLAACGGGKSNTSQSFEVAATDTKAEIEFAVWQSDTDWDGIIAGFAKKYPKIKVKKTAMAFSDYFTRLQTQASSDNLPDVFLMNSPNVQLYAQNDKLASLQSLVDDGAVKPDTWPKAVYEPYTHDGEPYALPYTYDAVALWFNKKLFAAASVDLPTKDWTWEDFHTAAKTISSKLKSKGVYGFAGGSYNQELTYNLIAQAGGQVLNEDATKSEYASPPAQQALQLLRDMVEDGSSPSIKTTSDTPPPDLFMNGKAAMVFAGSFRTKGFSESDVADDIDVVEMPRGKRRGMVIIGASLAVSASSSQKAAAAAFVKHMESAQVQREIATSGSMIPIAPGLDKAYLDSQPKYNLAAYLNAAKDYSYPYPVSLNTQAWVNVETQEVPRILSGKVSVTKGTKALADKIDALLAKEKK